MGTRKLQDRSRAGGRPNAFGISTHHDIGCPVQAPLGREAIRSTAIELRTLPHRRRRRGRDRIGMDGRETRSIGNTIRNENGPTSVLPALTELGRGTLCSGRTTISKGFGWATRHIRYFGVPGNRYALAHFRFTVSHLWHHALERRSQKGRVQWERMQRLIRRWLPPAHICHPYPSRRLRVTT